MCYKSVKMTVWLTKINNILHIEYKYNTKTLTFERVHGHTHVPSQTTQDVNSSIVVAIVNVLSLLQCKSVVRNKVRGS